MNQPIYDKIGVNYNANRRADPRIVDRIVALLDLPPGALIADIGAGTGNYANALGDLGYKVLAVEPSRVMIRQSVPHPNVSWFQATAEAVPLKDESVAGIIAILCLHHLTSVPDAAKELRRICPQGPWVIMTYDPRPGKDFWFYRYFPGIYRQELGKFPTKEAAAAALSGADRKIRFVDFPLPADLADKNMHAGWNRPEYYFDEQARGNSSGFARTDQKDVAAGLEKLKRDLASGDWEKRYGYLRQQKELHTGFVFIKLSAKKDGAVPDDIVITKASVKDAEEIFRLQRLAYISEAEIINDFTIPPLVQTLKETLVDYKTNTVLKAVSGGKIVGSVRGELKEDGSVYIGKLMVNPDIQNQGLGARLMNAIEAGFPGVKKFWLFTGQQSQRNLYLYHKLGYKDTGTERVNDKLTIVMLEKNLK